MATICATRPALMEQRPTSQLSINTSQAGTPRAIPHKHIPYCSPGPRPASRGLDTPPASPPAPSQLVETTSLTYPPNGYEKICNDPPVYSITASKLLQAVEHLATQPLPSAQQVFPWLHGLHAENQLQLAFFVARKKALRRTPKCIRGLTIVKTGGDLSHSKLKGAIAPEELLAPFQVAKDIKSAENAEFMDADPRDGFSVRNFQIQGCKMATLSDIVIYRDGQTSKEQAERLARRISRAQAAWQKRMDVASFGSRHFNTFVVSGQYCWALLLTLLEN